MAREQNNFSGNTSMLVLKLLEAQDRYGYELIEALAKESNNVFQLKTGTLYPILHNLERDGMVTSYEKATEGKRSRRYYHITKDGRGLLEAQKAEWTHYANSVNQVLEGGLSYG